MQTHTATLNSGVSGSQVTPSGAGVTLIVVTYESSKYLPEFFGSLALGLEGVTAYELVVVDNASKDDSVLVAQQLAPPNTKILARDSNGGYAAGVNSGIAAASPGNDVVILNPDIRLGPGCVRRLLENLEQPGVGISGPRILDPSGELQPSLFREPSVLRAWGEAILGGRRAGRFSALGETIVNRDAYQQPTRAAWLSGAAMAISRRCVNATGRWNESFFLYSEETEFCLRAKDAGYQVCLEPTATAVHVGGEMATSPRLWSMQVWNRIRLYRTRNGQLKSVLFQLGVILNEALRSLRSGVHRAGLRTALFSSHRPPEVVGNLTPQEAPQRPPSYVCFSAQDFWYHNRAHSDIQLMRNVAASRRVLFVNSIGMRMPLPGRSTMPFRRVWRKLKSISKLVRRPISELPNFYVMTPITIPLYGSALARRMSAALVRLQVRLVMFALRFDQTVYVVTIPTSWDVVSKLPRVRLIYNRSDLHSSFPEADKQLIERYEANLLAAADFVCYVSRALMATERPSTGERAIFIDHGVDLHHFCRTQGTAPSEVCDLPRPRIGFFGGLDDYIIDFDLLERIAREFPEASLILVGDATCSMSRFDQLPNVHWIGYRSYEEIPAYGSSFDVGIMPWLDNEWIHHSNPIKLKEYLALGLPIVTTDFPEARHYSDYLLIARNSAEFIDAIRSAITNPPNPTRQRSAVLSKSWARRAQYLVELCENGSEPAGMEN